MELPATAALDFPTVLALAGYVAQSLGGAAEQSSAGALATAVSLDAAWSDCSGGSVHGFGRQGVLQCTCGALTAVL